jgi:2-methylcitrate dehydratase PrpD
VRPSYRTPAGNLLLSCVDDRNARASEFVAETRIADLPADVVARGSLILADCVGCMVAGSAAPEMRRLVALEADRGKPCATALGRAVRPAEDAAAYVNGTAGTWHDLDEGNLSTRTHAAIQIIPAALAEAKARNLSGARLLEACIFAYEASARLWRATQSRLAATPMNEEIRKKILALLN